MVTIARKDWLDLGRRFSEAKGPDRDLDIELTIALGLPPTHMRRDPGCFQWYAHVAPDDYDTFEAPRFTTDIKAVIDMIKRTMPGYRYMSVGGDPCPTYKAIGAVWQHGRFGNDECKGETEELALCTAYCIARADQKVLAAA